MSNRSRGRCRSRYKGKADRRGHKGIEMHSKETLLRTHARLYAKGVEQLYAVGGPVTHLTPDDYRAVKIVEEIQKLTNLTN